MVCATCGNTASRVRIRNGKEACSACGGFSDAGGIRIDGVLSRQRTRDQGAKYEGDILNPWRYDGSGKKFVPNEEFVKRHAVSAENFFQPKDLKDYPKLAEKIRNRVGDTTKVEGVGDESKAQKETFKQP